MREKEKLSINLLGIKNMGSLPDVLFVVDVKHERNAIQEANRLGIVIIGIVDTNANPENINYVVPGNDDAMCAIQLYCKAVADTIINARSVLELKKEKNQEKEIKIKTIVKKVITKKIKMTENMEVISGDKI